MTVSRPSVPVLVRAVLAAALAAVPLLAVVPASAAATASPTVTILPDQTELGLFPAGVAVSSTVVNLAGSTGPTSWRIVSGALSAGLSMTVPQPAARPPRTP